MGDHNFNMSGGRFCFALLSLGILLLLGSAKVKAENRTEPTDNVNMSPNQIWRSTYFCLYYKPLSWCGPESHKLTINGTLNVTDTEVGDFCDRGCANQTRRMLDCLYAVNRHFWFINNATVKVINNTINYACDTKTAFNTTSYERSSAIKVGQKLYVPFISTLVFIAMFKM